ncbi:PARS2 (predicted), partial [Pycnogonum litorale]
TFEEAVTEVIASLSQPPSKSFPLKLYQITRKYRDELRSHLGLLRSKEFYMKDMYSFDVGLGEAKHAYEQVCLAYESIVNRLQLSDHYAKVVGDTGIIGGSLSHEYHLLADVGQDVVLLCPKCKIGRNIVINDSPTQICDVCSSNLDTKRGIEVAHTFLLETKYSKIFDASYLSKEKQTELLQMGCYGIGISRLLAASVEVLSTDELIRWPHPIVPYEICIVPPKMGSKEAASSLMADHLYDVLSSIFPNDVIIDDRTNLSIGRRVLDAKRLGFPFVIVCGKHTLETLPKIELNDVYGSSRCLLTHSELIAKFKYLRNVTNR